MNLPGDSTAASRPLRLVMVLPTYLPESFGGAEQQSRKLAEEFVRLGNSVTILAPRLQASSLREQEVNGVHIRRFRLRAPPNFGGRHTVSFLAWCAKISLWLTRHRHEVDVIQVVHGRLHALPAVVAARLTGKPVVIKIGRGGPDEFDLNVVKKKKIYGLLAAWIIKRFTSGYVANSKVIVEDLVTAGIPKSRIYNIPNGVELPGSDFHHKRCDSNEATFVYLGRFDAEKALDKMLAGFAEATEYGDTVLRLFGAGPCQADLERQAAALGISDRVELRPPVEDVGSILRNADFYVSTSLSEGMSNALLEAMSFGVPGIVSRVSGVDDIVTPDRSGLLFEAGDNAGYVAAIRTALSLGPDAWLNMAQEAQRAVRERFGMKMVAHRYISLYRSLLPPH
jgi:glycosyltransferase involved in cell wall biosynthesis